jgi:hypothetical protein
MLDMLDPEERGWVSVYDFAKLFGTDPSNTRRWLVQASEHLGLERVSARGNRGATMRVWRSEDAERLVQLRQDRGYALGRDTTPASTAKVEAASYVYLLRLDPDTPNRLKCGFSTSLQARLADHRTIAPRLHVLAVWEAPEWAEKAALAALAAMPDARRIGEEVFDAPAEDALARLTTLFEIVGARARI